MLERYDFSEQGINVHELLNDAQYIDNQMRSLKSDLQYVMKLIEAFDREFERMKHNSNLEALCQN